MLPQCDDLLSAVKYEYAADHRQYHTWSGHITHMLDKFSETRGLYNYPDAVYLAIIFHDIVYNTADEKYFHNEVLSCAWMVKALKEYIPEYISSAEGKVQVRFAIDLIMATKKHDPYRNAYVLTPKQIDDVKLFLDLDLGIFAVDDKDILDWFESSIRKEFSQYHQTVYNDGRLKVLNAFVEREKIFYSEPMQKFNDLAKSNINYLIGKLEKGE